MCAINFMAVKSFVETNFPTAKDYNKMIARINQKVSLLSSITNNKT